MGDTWTACERDVLKSAEDTLNVVLSRKRGERERERGEKRINTPCERVTEIAGDHGRYIIRNLVVSRRNFAQEIGSKIL